MLYAYVCHQGVGSAVENRHLFFYAHRGVLQLNQKGVVLTSFVKCGESDLVHVGRELGEALELGVLGLFDLKGSGHLLHTLHLGCATYAGYGDSDVYGRAYALVEKGAFQVDLSVGNGDDVSRDVSRDVAGLGLDDREGRK